jgi:protocatechuate 3,4-dioxygenase, alpha subunit
VSGDARPIATGSQTVGPFFHFGLAIHPEWGTLSTENTRGERLRLHVRVLDGDEAPVPDALVEVWQADADGRYAPRTPDGPPPPFWGFGRLPTDAEGDCVFETIRPGRTERGSAAHINICLFMRGLLRHLYTRVYFADDADLDVDPVLALVPADRRGTLVASPDPASPADWHIDIRLQGEGETVFFDL